MRELDVISKYQGIPYKHQGRDMNGLDCWGLLILIYKDLGHELWDIDEDYTPKWSWEGRNYFIENYHREWTEVTEPVMFDVVLFFNSKEIANHAGVMLSKDMVIHCCRAGVVLNRISELRKYTGHRFYRFNKR